MKMLNCPECGLTITDTQKECPKCRTKIETIKEELEKEDENAKGGKEVKKSPAKKVVSKKEKEAESEAKKVKSKKDEMIEAAIRAEDEATKDTVSTVKEEMIAAVVEAEALAAIEEEVAALEEKLCNTCLAPVNDGQNFCQLCGTSVEAIEETVNPVIPKTDAESNRLLAAIGYLLFFFPILCGYYRKSAFARFHAKQATLLFISSTALFLGLVILREVINSLLTTTAYISDINVLLNTAWQHGFGVFFHFYLVGMINLLHLMPFALMLIGIFNAMQGKKKPLPIIGRLVKKEKATE